MSRNQVLISAAFVILAVVSPFVGAADSLVRGDVNADSEIDVSDPVALLLYLFAGEPRSLPCEKSADVDDSGTLDVADSLSLLEFVFLFGPEPAAPFPQCGADPTPDDLQCASFSPCQGVTVFHGGSLEDLRLMSPDLTFGHLVVAGTLNLPLGGSAALNVVSFTLTEEGRIGYSRGECDFGPAPDLAVEADESVLISGEIQLTGVSGRRSLSDATCRRTSGFRGGEVRIKAKEIEVQGTILSSGGRGSTSVLEGGCSFGSAGGDGAPIRLEAERLLLSGASISSLGGRGGTGHCFGDENHGSAGTDGTVSLIASTVRMEGGSVSTDGALVLAAETTDIYGSLVGRLEESIGGLPDEVGPELEVLSPTSGSAVSVEVPLEVRIRVRDVGTGVRELELQGLGYEEGRHSADDVENGIFRVVIPRVTPPPALIVTAWDNKGFSTTATVTDLRFTGDLALESGETLYLPGDLDLGPDASVDIRGKIVLQDHGPVSIRAGRFTVRDGGRIESDRDAGRPRDEAPSLSILVGGAIDIAGTIDLRGRDGISEFGKQEGEAGGNLRLEGSSIALSGNILADGGKGQARDVGDIIILRTEPAPGGNGGSLSFVADTLVLSGAISLRGGNGSRGPCVPAAGGVGGWLSVSYADQLDFSGSVIDASGGHDCVDGAVRSPGNVAVEYTGPGQPPPLPFIEVEELEPNAHPETIQGVVFGAAVRLRAAISASDDEGHREYAIGEDVIEDLFLIHLDRPGRIAVDLEVPEADSVIGLYIIRCEDLFILERGFAVGQGLFHLETLDLDTGPHIVAVSWLLDTGGTSYVLDLQPVD